MRGCAPSSWESLAKYSRIGRTVVSERLGDVYCDGKARVSAGKPIADRPLRYYRLTFITQRQRRSRFGSLVPEKCHGEIENTPYVKRAPLARLGERKIDISFFFLFPQLGIKNSMFYEDTKPRVLSFLPCALASRLS